MTFKSFKNKNSDKLEATFGVLTDVQYADIDNVYFDPSKTRFYRNSLKLVKAAVNSWIKLEQETNKKLDFILQLGDIIDGYRNKEATTHQPSVDRVVAELEGINKNTCSDKKTHIYHVWGNHELYAFTANYLASSKLNTAREIGQETGTCRNYYRIDVTDNMTIICLDQYEIGVLGLDKTSEQFLAAHNTIEASKLEPDDLFKQRYRPWNGGISETQLSWLKDVLDDCKTANRKVLLCGHVPLIADAADTGVVWNSEEILELVWSYGSTVMAYLCGHYHCGGFYIDKNGVRHLTVPAILERMPDGLNSYVTGLVFRDRFELKNNADDSINFTVYFEN
jgi:manganese-dependent ADP-ribose/CDP-alcohol diphosphatase